MECGIIYAVKNKFVTTCNTPLVLCKIISYICIGGGENSTKLKFFVSEITSIQILYYTTMNTYDEPDKVYITDETTRGTTQGNRILSNIEPIFDKETQINNEKFVYYDGSIGIKISNFKKYTNVNTRTYTDGQQHITTTDHNGEVRYTINHTPNKVFPRIPREYKESTYDPPVVVIKEPIVKQTPKYAELRRQTLDRIRYKIKKLKLVINKNSYNNKTNDELIVYLDTLDV